MVKAIQQIDTLNLIQKEILVDEIYKNQPNLLASVLVHTRYGAPMEKIDTLLHILLVAYLAAKQAKLNIKQITEEDLEKYMQRYVGHVMFTEGMNDRLKSKAINQWIDEHPEKWLLAYAYDTMLKSQFHIMNKESDKYLIITGVNIVNAVAYC